MTSPVSSIKRAQKESLLFREISQLFMQAALDNEALRGITINRVRLSPDKGICTVLFYTPEGEDAFKKVLPKLLSYKSSFRKALAQRVRSRYTPELVFVFDTQFKKQQRIEELLEKVRDEE